MWLRLLLVLSIFSTSIVAPNYALAEAAPKYIPNPVIAEKPKLTLIEGFKHKLRPPQAWTATTTAKTNALQSLYGGVFAVSALGSVVLNQITTNVEKTRQSLIELTQNSMNQFFQKAGTGIETMYDNAVNGVVNYFSPEPVHRDSFYDFIDRNYLSVWSMKDSPTPTQVTNQTWNKDYYSYYVDVKHTSPLDGKQYHAIRQHGGAEFVKFVGTAYIQHTSETNQPWYYYSYYVTMGPDPYNPATIWTELQLTIARTDGYYTGRREAGVNTGLQGLENTAKWAEAMENIRTKPVPSSPAITAPRIEGYVKHGDVIASAQASGKQLPTVEMINQTNPNGETEFPTVVEVDGQPFIVKETVNPEFDPSTPVDPAVNPDKFKHYVPLQPTTTPEGLPKYEPIPEFIPNPNYVGEPVYNPGADPYVYPTPYAPPEVIVEPTTPGEDDPAPRRPRLPEDRSLYPFYWFVMVMKWGEFAVDSLVYSIKQLGKNLDDLNDETEGMTNGLKTFYQSLPDSVVSLLLLGVGVYTVTAYLDRRSG